MSAVCGIEVRVERHRRRVRECVGRAGRGAVDDAPLVHVRGHRDRGDDRVVRDMQRRGTTGQAIARHPRGGDRAERSAVDREARIGGDVILFAVGMDREDLDRHRGRWQGEVDGQVDRLGLDAQGRRGPGDERAAPRGEHRRGEPYARHGLQSCNHRAATNTAQIPEIAPWIGSLHGARVPRVGVVHDSGMTVPGRDGEAPTDPEGAGHRSRVDPVVRPRALGSSVLSGVLVDCVERPDELLAEPDDIGRVPVHLVEQAAVFCRRDDPSRAVRGHRDRYERVTGRRRRAHVRARFCRGPGPP